MVRRTFLVLAFALSFFATVLGCDDKQNGGAAATGSGKAGERRLKIAVIPKGTTHEFWKAVHAGAVKASIELNVEIVWKGPLKEDDLKDQIDLVEQFRAQQVNGIVLAPLNDKALMKSVKDSTRSKIPVVIFDSALQGDHHKSFVATDNLAAGKLAGQRMGKLLDNKGKIMVLRYQEGSASTTNREDGFIAAVKAIDGLDVVSDNQYGGATTESALSTAESLLVAQKAADGGVDGIFCPNESTTFGMLLALQKLGLAGNIKFIGFDASEKLIKALEDKHLDALVLQDPFNMGYLGVKTMVSVLKGEKVDKVTDTGSTLVDVDNMKKPEIAKLLKPELKKWLGQ